jgi:hypothetical protein
MARPTIYLPDVLLKDARAAGVNVSGACREGLAARTYGDAVLVPSSWYAMALAVVGGDGPGSEPPPVWSPEGLSVVKSAAQGGRQDQEEIEHRLDQLDQRVSGTEGALRGLTTYAVIGCGILLVGVAVYAYSVSTR